ncbi:ABC transporter ATP-binding protein [Rhodoblastus acidophilus]|uniref:ABC transporter ATP-binding protein n=1 Tax=Candidatus Rhodoblastus alkanivorans TaxID=2954117 RepID=A0ABS9Z5G6_9HYPH|nr:ABC transporter ATP-binding protein [Candidatus Rhodoblastus alkanivorans]MCI4682842.1 ABC transporter ATP-binding protein [Candidatus Rhodoblastus alkanivorans]MDI4640152.1 ABC transporter ATP-binding protein [Rhodoblastus acidophilus]
MLSDLRLAFPGQGAPALDGVRLDLLPGETLCLLGPSGCGKSTLLRLIAGIEQPDSGEIRWRDGVAPKIGFVFQEPTLMPWADLFANVHLPLRLAGVSRRDAAPKVEAALAGVGLSDRLRALPRELSGGMKMRVSIARALVDEPELLLLDEPFAALDEITRWQLNDALLDLRRKSAATVVFVTHSVYESAYLADRVAIMRARPGRIDSILSLERGPTRGLELRRSAVFAQDCARIAEGLQQAMGRAA